MSKQAEESIAVVKLGRSGMKAAAVPLRRNFVARKEGCNNTWINKFGVYVRDYGTGGPNEQVLGPDECQSIPDEIK